jgi:adenosylcobinamide-GDP ribazoletransferase
MKKILVAISFYTRIPIHLKNVSEDEFYSSMRLIPLVGVLIGGVLFGLHWLLGSVPGDIRGLVMAVAYILLSGGLHIDGFMDSLDGLLSNRDKAKVFEIMKDSRVGAFGVLGILVLFAVLTQFLQYADGWTVFLFPVVGRCGALISAAMTQYAKEKKELGARFVDETTPIHGWMAGLFALALTIPAGWFYGAAALVAFAITWVLTKWTVSKIGGNTGDTIGMMIESTQAAFLIGAFFLI